jgi:hypothetical protein
MFENIQEFESFAREYSDAPVLYEHGNCIDFYAHIELRASGEWLSFMVEFEYELEAIEADPVIHDLYCSDELNLEEAFQELEPKLIFTYFADRIKLIKP